MIETIKSYLVGLGFEIENNSYKEVKDAMTVLEKKITSFASSTAIKFGEASIAITAFAAAATFGIAKFVNSLGNQEIQMQMLARTLWTTQQNAYAFSLTLKALGANLQQLYLSPTLMKQYRELNSLALGLTPPAGYQGAMNEVQSLSLQFKEMKLESYYTLQWIGYYFIKYMNGPIKKVESSLSKINHYIQKQMPTWAIHIGKWMASFVQAGYYVGQALLGIYKWMTKLLSYVPGWAKGIAAAIGVIALAFDASPLGLFAMALTAIILLFDDFETYLHHGKSAFAPFWAELMKLAKYKTMVHAFAMAVRDIAIAFGIVKVAMMGVNIVMKVMTALQAAFDVVAATDPLVWIILAIIAAITALIIGIVELVKHWKEVKKWGTDALTTLESIATKTGYKIKSVFDSVWNGIKKGFVSSLNWIIGEMNKVIGAMDKLPGISIKLIPLIKQAQKNSQNMGLNTGNVQDASGNIASYADTQGNTTGPSYAYAHTTNNVINKTTNNVNVNQTNNVTGNDAQATGNAIQRNLNLHFHNLRGLIG